MLALSAMTVVFVPGQSISPGTSTGRNGCIILLKLQPWRTVFKSATETKPFWKQNGWNG